MKVEAEATGRPPYAPGDLLKLYVYGYLNQVRSSRRLEREARRNLEVLWLINRVAPSFKTIADFRKDHSKAIVGVCALLSGLIFWTLYMALIFLGSERFAAFWTRKEISVMRHHNTVLHQFLKLIAWAEFDRLVDEHRSDKHVRTLSTRSQLIAMLFAQHSGAASLREIEGGLQSHTTCLYHLGVGGAKPQDPSSPWHDTQCRANPGRYSNDRVSPPAAGAILSVSHPKPARFRSPYSCKHHASQTD